MIPAPPGWTDSAHVLAELQRLTVDAERVRADLAAAERRGYEAGVADTVRAFWVAVCEQRARASLSRAACARRLGLATREVEEHDARAAQYRAWAREGG